MSDPFFSISIVFTVKIKPRPPQVQQKKKQLANSSFRSIEVLFYIFRKEEFFYHSQKHEGHGGLNFVYPIYSLNLLFT